MRFIRFVIPLVLTAALVACASQTSRVTIYPQSTVTTPPAASAAGSVIVGKGDTLYGIARKHGIPMRDLAAWNCLDAPYVVQQGQSLVMQATSRSCASVAQPPAAIATAPVVSEPRPVTSSTTLSNNIRWVWPAEGNVTPIRSANRVSGIEISNTAGTPVRAAADGIVLYSGQGLPGQEEVIVIKHADGWISSYAHNRRRLLAEDARVTAGMPIAEMGLAPTNRAVLRFELRNEGELVDPTAYLPAR